MRKDSIDPSYSRWTVHTMNAQWFGDVQASVVKCRWPGCSWSNLAIRAWHFSKDALMSQEMVWFEGSSMLGWPAVNRSCNLQSLIMLAGWLFSVTYLMRYALLLIHKVSIEQHLQLWTTYQTSGLVWTWCEYFTGHLPLCAKSAKMELLSLGACLPAIAVLITSSPKQQRVWCLRLAVDDLSDESWKQQIMPTRALHLGAAQVKTWHGQPS